MERRGEGDAGQGRRVATGRRDRATRGDRAMRGDRATRQGNAARATRDEGDAWQWRNTTERRGEGDATKGDACRWGGDAMRVTCGEGATRDEGASRRACEWERERLAKEKKRKEKNEPACASSS